jgi:hypothetical protein
MWLKEKSTSQRAIMSKNVCFIAIVCSSELLMALITSCYYLDNTELHIIIIMAPINY